MIIQNNIEWLNYQGVLIPNVPPHISITLSRSDINTLLKQSNAYFIRWNSNWDCKTPTEFWHVIKDSKPSLESLSSNTRHNVRRGLKRCQFKKTTVDALIKEGYNVYLQAFNQYQTFITPQTKVEFIENLQSLSRKSGWEFWEARNADGQLIAYSINLVRDHVCEYKTTKFDPDFSNNYTSEGLFYTMNDYYLNELQLTYIDDGSRSLSHQTNIQDYFINKFGFRKAYCKMNIAYAFKTKLAVTLLYPFKPLLEKMSSGVIQKIVVLLKHEEIRRSFET